MIFIQHKYKFKLYRYSDSYNQEVATGLMSHLEIEFGGEYSRYIIQSTVSAHYIPYGMKILHGFYG